ncbi:MAG: glycoside hydrolase family 78 protein [Dysgonamonadaceae bacterium]|jgi:alpha-L-rhamnosidase|nr:glycoside hydrolase family 78 protein [Dysgonamonadaceae bacterium]
MKKTFFLSLLLALIASSCANKADLKIYALRCEYLTEPLGIDNPYQNGQMLDYKDFSPRLTWKVEGKSETGKQKAYRLVLKNNDKILWDSGIVESEQQFCFLPAGILKSNSVYRWYVSVYEKDLKRCCKSEAASFTTGLAKSDWQGKWIYMPDTVPEKQVWFRKTFELDAVPETVFAYLASSGYHELYVNGSKTGDIALAPAISRIDKRILYITYDISKFLKKGKNVIAVNYAPGWTLNAYFKRKSRRALLLQVYDAEEKFSLSTDTTWKCSESYSRNIGRFDFMDMGGELVDGRRFTDKWANIDFDDGDWQNASLQQFENEPVLSAQMTDPTKIIETIGAKNITEIPDSMGNTIYRADMGKDFTGFLEASFNGLQAGDTVEIMVSMRDRNPKFVRATYGVGDYVIEEQKQRQIYIARGEDGETFRNRFNFFAGRYIHFRGLRKASDLQSVKGLAISSAPDFTAAFDSSDSLYNRIFDMDKYTFQMCHTEGVTVDCPNRERLGYGPEGAWQTLWGLALPCFNSSAYCVKNVRDWADVQYSDGFINNVAPQISQMYGCALNGASILNIAVEHYRICRDRRILETAWPTAVKWLGFLEKYVKNDMLTPYDKEGYFLGEWVSPGPVFEYGETEEALFFNNCVYAATLDFMIEAAGELGREQSEIERLKTKLSTLRKALHQKYYKPEIGSYQNCDQVRTAFALYAGIVPDSLKTRVGQYLENRLREQGFINIGSFGRYPFYKTVLQDSAAFALLADILAKTTYPGYGYFLENDCTTFPEMWEIDQPNSTVIHTSYTGISAFFIKGLAGIGEYAEVAQILIKPRLVERLSHCSASVETPFGRVKSGWIKENGKVKYSVSIPFGMTAKFVFPDGNERILSAGEYSF